ncbi:S-layer homology domain-containing protein [Pseudoflavonifractor phocaeensis]|uniref:S-layer homology domain-containing protein n=1 Tax=Pseudoflavonifractor phocaeensis TaxID=1870988 RepID=UPI00195E1968|nr:S-layer homology domain-containing protein [Pseudoflavonifractor phocaeensis]MBM6887881.1 S-layer homology domain-containing protein [Pseudoflavonifractor phocaeensis]
MRKRVLSLLCVLALCLGLLPTTALADFVVVDPGGDGGGSTVDVDPNNPDNVVVIVPGGDGNTTVVVIPDDEPEPAAPVIGDTVEFAGHAWYIIGTETEGVKAPAGCYTLFAKRDDFGSTTFRDVASMGDSTENHYKDSDLHKKMEEIASSSLSEYKDDIVPRGTLDAILGDPVTNQLLWPISFQETGAIDKELLKFSAVSAESYWTRQGYTDTDQLHVVYAIEGATGEKDSVDGTYNSYTVRPALYVKAEAVTLVPDIIGDTVNFAGHEWYIVGTETEGVKAPAGCYTLFAKNNDFGSATFRAGADKTNSTANYYKDSGLYNKMNEIANGFSNENKANIVSRDTLDNIAGDTVSNQLVWPIGMQDYGPGLNGGVNGEAALIDRSIRQFDQAYWTRTNYTGGMESSPAYYTFGINTDGSSTYGSAGTLGSHASEITDTLAVRPALYVKAEALEPDDGKQAAPLIGGTVAFGGRDWYIVGMGDGGAVTGPANTVTLFAPTLLTDSNKQLIQAQPSANYSEGQLCTVLQGLGDTLGLSERETDLISSRTLTTADEITGDSVTTPFWPLSKSEFEAIKSVNPSLLKDLKADTGSYNGFYYSLRTSDGADKVYSVTEHGVLKSDRPYNDYVRPAFYLDISELFFAAGFMSVAWKGDPPRKIEPPSVDNNVWTFVLYDKENLSLKMGCKEEQTGESLTFKYEGTQGENHWLSYVLEKTDNPGIPVYYGSVASLKESGSGTVTVPLLGYGSDLEDGDYTLRFYTEDQSNMGFYLASDTVDMTIHVEGGEVSITNMGDVDPILGIIDVTIEPRDVTLEAGKTQQFTATVTGGGDWYDPSVVWSVKPKIIVQGESLDPGTTITQDGLLTVSTEEKTPFLLVTATSAQDPSKSYWIDVTVIPHTHIGTFQAGSPATCSQNGVKDYYTCTCGKAFEDEACTKLIEDLDNWKVIPALPHQCNFVPGTPATCTTDGVKDYYQCSVCHQYFEDADCNTPITDLDNWKVIPALPHQGTLVPGTPATCTTDGVKDYYQCSVCHQYFENADCTKSIADLDSWKVILAPGHTWTGSYLAENADGSKHYHVCTICGTRDGGEAHAWNVDAPTEQNDKHCTICGYVAEAPIGHIHAGTLVPGQEATCTQSGSKAYYTCTCQQNFEDEACATPIIDLGSWRVIPPTGHIWSDTYLAEQADESKHYHVCTVCGERDVGEAHTWNAEAATEEHDKHCTVCGYVAEEQLEHTHTYGTEWTWDGDVHWHECACGAKADVAVHAYDNDQDTTCNVCSYVRQPMPQEYTVAFDANGGSVSQTSAVTTGGRLASLPTPTRAGYDFVGWYTAASGGDTVTIDTVFTGNTTIYAHWNIHESSGSGGGNGGGDTDPTYSITLPGRVTGGSVTATKRYAEQGEIFRFTVTPDVGWELDALAATDSKGKEIDLTHKGGNEYTFKMPAGRVEIEVSFREIAVELPFTDVPEDAWYADAAAYVYEHGLMAGTSTTAFSPDATTSRSMIATILWRMAGSPVVNYAMDYTDVAQGQWYSEAIRWAASEGIMGGYGNGLFGTNDPITREQFAAMLYRFAQEQGYDVSIGENTNILSYTDVADLSEYAISAMQWAVGAGIINGTGDGSTLTPQGQATRAQAAVMLMRFCELDK